MALKDIINTILEEAAKKAKRAKDEAAKEVGELERKYKVKAKEEEEKVLAEAKVEQDRILDEAKFISRLQARNRLLAKKQELVSRVFDQAQARLAKLSEDTYFKLLVSLLKKMPIGEGKIEIVPVKGKEAITQEAIKKAKRDFVLSYETLNKKGGFILKSEDFEIDSTFETLLKEKKERLETKIAQILFH